MRIQNSKKPHKKFVIVIIVIVILVAAGVAGYFLLAKPSPKSTVDTTIDSSHNSAKTDANSTDSDSSGSANIDNSATVNSTTPTTEPGKIPPQTDAPTTTGNNLQISASAFANGSYITVQTTAIYPILQSGTCTLTIGNYSTSSAINPGHNGPDYSICETFLVPASSASGNNFTLNVTSGNYSGSTSGGIQ